MPHLQEVIMKQFAKNIVRRLMRLIGFSDTEEEHREPTPEEIEDEKRWEEARKWKEQFWERMRTDPKYREEVNKHQVDM